MSDQIYHVSNIMAKDQLSSRVPISRSFIRLSYIVHNVLAMNKQSSLYLIAWALRGKKVCSFVRRVNRPLQRGAELRQMRGKRRLHVDQDPMVWVGERVISTSPAKNSVHQTTHVIVKNQVSDRSRVRDCLCKDGVGSQLLGYAGVILVAYKILA